MFGCATKGLLAIAMLALASCAQTGSSPEASPRATHQVREYTPTSVALYLARREIAGLCKDDLSPSIEFAPEKTEVSPSEGVELQKWALCLQRPELRGANVVLVPTQGSAGATLFAERARQLRDALAARGVDPVRVTVAAPTAGAESGAPSPVNAIRLEITRSGVSGSRRPE